MLYRQFLNFDRPRMCSWWHQEGRSTWCLQPESWSQSLLFHLSCTAEEARPVSLCTSELKHTNRWQILTLRLFTCLNSPVLLQCQLKPTAMANLQAWCGPHPEQWEQSSCPLCSPWSPRGSTRPWTGWPWLVVELLVHQACREGKKRSDGVRENNGPDRKAAEKVQ